MDLVEILPVEILHLIAAVSPESYRAMLALPPFARSLDPGVITDYMIMFGHSVRITYCIIAWERRGKLHRIGGPALEYLNGAEWHRNRCLRMDEPPDTLGVDRFWYKDGELHRDDGPAVELADDGSKWYCNGMSR